MSVIYSGQTILNTSVDGSTQNNFNQGLKNALISAGWSLQKDGSSDGVWRVRSVTTPQGLQGDLWLYNGAGTGTPPAVLEAASTLSTSQTGTSGFQNQLPINITCGTGITYNLIATGFYFYLYRTTNPCPGNGSYFWSTPYIPANLTNLITSLVVAYGSTSGTDTICNNGIFGSTSGAFCYLNGAGHTTSGAFTLWGITQVTVSGVVTILAVTWFDGSVEFYEPRVMGFQTSSAGAQTGAQRALGYQWDALVLNQALPRGTTIAYDGNSWIVLTENIAPSLLILNA
jgi:hypothetical protein